MSNYTKFVWQIALSWWGAGIACGLGFLGLGQIIEMLESIHNKLEHIRVKMLD